MSRLFDRAAVFTDIHFGKKSDSEEHNLDCANFVNWFCQLSREQDCDAVIFMGDWFDNRSRLRVDTIHYSWHAIQKLADLKVPVYWLIGNHDLYFRYNRTIHSLPYVDGNNFRVINTLWEVDDVLFCPWLTGQEFAEVPAYEAKYVFGHFELPLFLLNENVVMPDRGGLHADHFEQCEAVFSGHFHKRQCKVNEHGIPVWYIGNAFPHDFNDVNDTDRGAMVLPWGMEPEFHNWPDAPNFHRVTVTELMEIIEGPGGLNSRFDNHSIIECQDDVGMEVEEAMAVREALDGHVRELRLRPKRETLTVDQETDIGDDAQSVDQMVVEHLRMLDTEGSEYDPEILVALYESVGTA